MIVPTINSPIIPSGDLGKPTAQNITTQKRPRIDLYADLGSNRMEHKRGKTMFGVLLNTLNKAKAEDEERNGSAAVRNQKHCSVVIH